MPVSLRHDSQQIVDRQRRLDGIEPPKRAEPVPEGRNSTKPGPRARPWGPNDKRRLAELAAKGHFINEIAEQLERSPNDIGRKAKEFGITIRRQPRKDRWGRPAR